MVIKIQSALVSLESFNIFFWEDFKYFLHKIIQSWRKFYKKTHYKTIINKLLEFLLNLIVQMEYFAKVQIIYKLHCKDFVQVSALNLNCLFN